MNKLPEVLPPKQTRRPADPTVRSARILAAADQKRQAFDLARSALSNPLILGLGAMVLNEAAYRVGLYDPRPGEAEQSELGGPVWFKIGPSLPPAQAKRNFINSFIIGITTAQAMAPAMPAIIQAGTTVGKALAAGAA